MVARKGTPSSKKRLCDDIWRKLIVAPGQCERCGLALGPFEAAHIVRRRFSWTRTDERNGWCLCRHCHRSVDTHASAFMELVVATVGLDCLAALEAKSMNRAKFDWWAEHERLKALVRARTP